VTNALRPTLARAPGDYEQPWHVSCLAFARATTPPSGGACVYGDPLGSFTVALVGDSHASALFPGVNAVALAHHWKLLVYMKINCAFVDMPLYDPNAKREYSECDTWNNLVVARLNAVHANVILVSNDRWIQNARRADGTVTAEGNAMARQIGKLPASSRVLIIQDIPTPLSHDVPDCLSNHINDYRKCNYSRAISSNGNMGAREAIAVAATGAGLVDLTDAICPGTGDCPVVMNGMIMFRDDHHLTATFAEALGPALDQQIVAILSADEASPSPSPSPSPSSP
jgi:hypothetical protein